MVNGHGKKTYQSREPEKRLKIVALSKEDNARHFWKAKYSFDLNCSQWIITHKARPLHCGFAQTIYVHFGVEKLIGLVSCTFNTSAPPYIFNYYVS
jgi:hypothetical protein